MMNEHTRGHVSKLPVHDGDGYSWGGDIIVTFGDRSINLGTSQNYARVQEIEALARLLAAAPAVTAMADFLLDRLSDLEGGAISTGDIDGFWREWMGHVEPAIARLRAAIAKATDQGGEG